LEEKKLTMRDAATQQFLAIRVHTDLLDLFSGENIPITFVNTHDHPFWCNSTWRDPPEMPRDRLQHRLTNCIITNRKDCDATPVPVAMPYT
jgi:hypothetical protein